MRRWLIGLCSLVTTAVVLLVAPAGAAYDRPGKAERVNVSSLELQGRRVQTLVGGCHPIVAWGSFDATPNGRYVVFASDADNLVLNDTNLSCDVFLRDRVKGTTRRVSLNSDGDQTIGALAWTQLVPVPISTDPAISANGRYVALISSAANLVPNDTNLAWDVFVKDLATGKIERVSVSTKGEQGTSPLGANASSANPSLSADGRYVVFESYASNLVPNDTNGTLDVFVHDRTTNKTSRASLTDTDQQAGGGGFWPSISGNGRRVVFTSWDPTIVQGDTNRMGDVFVRDLTAKWTRRVSVGSNGREVQTFGESQSDASGGRLFSHDGRYVLFHSSASELVPNDTNFRPRTDLRATAHDIFLHDLATHRTERISVRSTGEQATYGSEASYYRDTPITTAGFTAGAGSISPDGRYITFSSLSDDLSTGEKRLEDTDVYVHDRLTGETDWISTRPDGTESKTDCQPRNAVDMDTPIKDGIHIRGTGSSYGGSWDGSMGSGGDVTFTSCNSDLVPRDTNAERDIFFYDRGATAATGSTVYGGSAVATVAANFADVRGDASLLAADIISARVVHRPRQRDIYARLDVVQLASLTELGVPLAGGTGLLHGVRFTVGQHRFEARAAAIGPLSSLALYDCTTSCRHVADLKGGYGTTGETIVASIPASAVGLNATTRVTDVEGFSGLGTVATGLVTQLDLVQERSSQPGAAS